jgi:hypothetical protein
VAVTASAAEFPSHPLVRGRYLGTWVGAPSRTLPPRAQP